MSTSVDPTIERQRQIPEDRRLLFSVSDYWKMADAGIIPEKPRTELIDGQILLSYKTDYKHGWCTSELAGMLMRHLPREHWTVYIRSTVEMGLDNAPDPDLCVLARPLRQYDHREPSPEEYVYVIEVSENSLEFDRTSKLSLYAEFGISNYWIVNLVDRVIEAYSEPYTDANSGQSIYKNCHIYAEQDSVTMPFDGLSPLVFKVAEILPGKPPAAT
ncbi:Uma2 family endonuclease [Lacunimicrobium album]